MPFRMQRQWYEIIHLQPIKFPSLVRPRKALSSRRLIQLAIKPIRPGKITPCIPTSQFFSDYNVIRWLSDCTPRSMPRTSWGISYQCKALYLVQDLVENGSLLELIECQKKIPVESVEEEKVQNLIITQ